MKIKSNEATNFKPFELTFVIESQEEEQALYAMLNHVDASSVLTEEVAEEALQHLNDYGNFQVHRVSTTADDPSVEILDELESAHTHLTAARKQAALSKNPSYEDIGVAIDSVESAILTLLSDPVCGR